MFLQSIYYPTNAIFDTPFMTHINSNMFGTEVLSLGSHYYKGSVPPYKNDHNLKLLKNRPKLACWLIYLCYNESAFPSHIFKWKL